MNEDVKQILAIYFNYLATEYKEIEKAQLDTILRGTLLNILYLNTGIASEKKLEIELKENFPEKRVNSMTEEYKHGLLVASMKCLYRVKEAC